MSLSRSLPVLAAALGAVLVSACGSGGSPSASHPAGEASKTAAQILADAQAALGAAGSFRIRFSGTSATDGPMTLDLVVSSGGVKGSMTDQGVTAQVIVAAGQAYIQGRAFFAKTAGADAAAVIGDRWVQLPAGQSFGFDGFNNPKTVALCLLSVHGTLVKGGTSSFQGQPTVQVLDRADIPGDAPGTVDVATTGPAYPLHLVQTGAATPGQEKQPAVCGSSSSDPSSGALTNMQATLSDFGAAVAITAPTDPFVLPSSTA